MSRLHLRPSAELLKIILEGTLPADSQMASYFRAHPVMGVHDRGQVAETVYGCLRDRRVLEYLCGDGGTTSDCLVAARLLRQGLSARALEDNGYRRDVRELAARVRTLDPATLPPEVRANLPDWLWQRLVAELGEPEALSLADALNRPAPVDLRVNSHKASREEVQQRLAKQGFETTPTPFSPVGLRRATRESLFNTAAFKDGLFEIQDEGSQLLSLLLEPRRNEMVVDFCAGAGGKTLHLGALMGNTGSLYAFDTSAKRLERLKPRLRRSGLQNVRTVAIAHERDERVQRLAGKADRVLVDAPCSGIGTLRRNPDIKWRSIDLAALVADQQRILAAAATLVKPDGRLVYATCSLLREENDEVVSAFLAAHASFTIMPAVEILARRHVTLDMPDAALRLLPHRHGTDGFFAMALQRSD
jgi:16S rRNA (cytosine967-C5)-methyltransferase